MEQLEFPQKVLIVDPELVENAIDREENLLELGVSEDLVWFAKSFDEALPPRIMTTKPRQ